MQEWSSKKIGVIIAQMGSPDAPTPEAVRRYLKEFLSDPHVVKQSLLWKLLLNLVILNTRPRRSAKLYQEIWTEEGPPLLAISRAQERALQAALSDSMPVVLGMRYGNPSIEKAAENLVQKGCSEILLFPMYPQYSSTSTASACDALSAALMKIEASTKIQVVEPYFAHEGYLKALADDINSMLQKPVDALLLSYHGLPLSVIKGGDPYDYMCKETTKGLKPLLRIEESRVLHVYQSRFGAGKWLGPATMDTLATLPRKRMLRVAVACPGFPADCLETLSEIGIEGKKIFLEAGGEEFYLIPCLNVSSVWIEAMKRIVMESVRERE